MKLSALALITDAVAIRDFEAAADACDVLAEAVLKYVRQLELDTVHSKSQNTLRWYRKQFGRDVFDQAKADYFANKDAVRWQQGAKVMWITPS